MVQSRTVLNSFLLSWVFPSFSADVGLGGLASE